MYVCRFAPSIIIYTSTSHDSHAKDDVPLFHPLPFPAKPNGPVCGSVNGLFGMPRKGQPLLVWILLVPSLLGTTRTRSREVDCDIRKLLW